MSSNPNYHGIFHDPACNHPNNPEAAPRAPRVIKRNITSPEETMSAAREFAAGKIDRAELMRRITPRKEWRA